MNKGKYDHITDQELLEKFYADHNNEWLGALLERYTMLLYGVSMKYLKNPEEARDAVQQIFLKAITETAKWTTEKILAIQKLIEDSCDFIKSQAPAIYTKELVELLFNQPYVRISNLIEMELAKRDTASKYLKTLCQIGFVEEIKRGRDKLFINHQFLNLLKQK